jgi:hypothetical protein
MDFRALWTFETVEVSWEKIASKTTVRKHLTSSLLIPPVSRRAWTASSITFASKKKCDRIPQEFCSRAVAPRASLALILAQYVNEN